MKNKPRGKELCQYCAEKDGIISCYSPAQEINESNWEEHYPIPQEQESWEKELESIFRYFGTSKEERIKEFTKNLIRNLLSSLHQEELKKLVEEIKKLRRQKSEKCIACGGEGSSASCKGGIDWQEITGFNEALDQVLQIILAK